MLCALVMSTSAAADYVIGAPVIVPADNSAVTIEFVSANAAYTGEFSFLGGGTVVQVTMPATDTGEPGLGQQVYVNQGGPTDAVLLQGTYDQGDVLHFAYRIVAPLEAADVLRTDVAADVNQFAWDAQNGLLHVEDIRATSDGGSDNDFNDIIVRITFTTVPTPGTALLTILGLLVTFRGRRRVA